MSVIAYIRKSTDKQSFEHQEYEIEQYAEKHNLKIDRWVEESISSRKELKKRQLGKLLEELQDGDILIATEISRLGRSLLEVMGILQTCLEKNCQVWTIKESYNLKNDFAQNEDLAAKEGKMLEEMKAEFLNSVGKYYNPNKKGETLK